MAKKTETKLDWLAQHVIGMIEEQGFDQPYIDDIKKTLTGQTRYSVLVWCNNLDSLRKDALAIILGVSEHDFAVTLKTVQKI